MRRFGVDSSGWLIEPRSTGPKSVNLICFPHAGASASVFFAWARLLPSEVGLCLVELPGRSRRHHEPAVTCVNQLVAAAAEALAPRLTLPFVLLGHSMGAVLAFELARELRRRALPLPSHLIVTGHRGPHLRRREPPIAHLHDAALVRAVQVRYRGIPPEILFDAAALRVLAPLLRADLTLLEQYRFSTEPPLECAITALGGDLDIEVTREDLEGWRQHTIADFDLQRFAGDHFFIHQKGFSITTVLRRALRPSERVPGGWSMSSHPPTLQRLHPGRQRPRTVPGASTADDAVLTTDRHGDER